MTHPKLARRSSGFGGRGYAVPFERDAAGKQLLVPSVTTVLKNVAKPGLHQWIADQTAAYAVENVDYLRRVSAERAWGRFRWYWSRTPDLVGTELRTYHEGVRDDAAELGTNVHEWIEAELEVMPHPVLDSIEAEEMAYVFQEWLDQHEVGVLATEFSVFGSSADMTDPRWDEHWRPPTDYAGTGDADWLVGCNHGGRPCLRGADQNLVRTLVDLKTSRHTWPEHGMQVAALSTARTRAVEVAAGTPGAFRNEKTEDKRKHVSHWLTEPNPDFEAMALLHLRPVDLSPSGEEMAPFARLIDLTHRRETYLAGFRGAVALAKMHKSLGVDVEHEWKGDPQHG